MGQAFDSDGRVLGEAFGESKREVFEKLSHAHPDAHELRIKTMSEKLDQAGPGGRIHNAELLTGEPMLKFFGYEHLPTNLQEVSKPFGELAIKIATELPRNPERTVALRKLLEAKDCAVRALLA